MGDVLFSALAESKKSIDTFPITPSIFGVFWQVTAGSSQQERRDVFRTMWLQDLEPSAAMKTLGIKSAADFDETALRAAVVAAVAANPKAVADYKGGKDAAKMSILGAVMKANKGAPNEVVRKLLDEVLKKL
jgi:aspartyl-tRNA(Asn)/glutamyl-tRNA(Gln) amidotransferase subunit B